MLKFVYAPNALKYARSCSQEILTMINPTLRGLEPNSLSNWGNMVSNISHTGKTWSLIAHIGKKMVSIVSHMGNV